MVEIQIAKNILKYSSLRSNNLLHATFDLETMISFLKHNTGRMIKQINGQRGYEICNSHRFGGEDTL